MSYNFSGQPGAANTNVNQPFSGFSNGSISYQQHQNNTIPLVQQFENGGQLSEPRPQNPSNRCTNQILSNFPANAVNLPTPTTQGYQQYGLPQQTLQNTWSQRVNGTIPADFYTNKFWTIRTELTLSDGQSVRGTFAELYQRYAFAHKEIWRHYSVQHARQVQSHQQASSPHVDATKSTKAQGKRPKLTLSSRRPGTAAVAMTPPPAYVADDDLDTPQKCRDYLAYIDPADVRALEFEDDDWEDVLEHKKHEFIGEMLEAMTHPYAQDPPVGITLTKEAREKYHKQQDTQTGKVLGLLQTAPQIKAAKALCSLLFDATVYVHKVGVPKEVYDGYQWYIRKERQVDRKYRLDLLSICSERLEKVVAGIQANKLIAMDVLEQTNFHRLARDPGFYLVEKFTYLRSNKTRQENIDRHNKQDEEDAHFGAQMGSFEAQAASERGKRRSAAVERGIAEMEDEEEDEEPDEDSDDSRNEVFEQTFKRMRR